MEFYKTYGWRPSNKNEVTSEGLTILKRGKISCLQKMIQNRARKQHQDRAGEEGGRRPGEPILFNVGQRSPFWLSILKYGFCQYSISNSVAILWYLWLAGIIFNKITTYFQVSGEEIWEEADKKEQVLYLQKIGDLKTKTPTDERPFKNPDI